MRGDTGTAIKFNKMLAGDDRVGIADDLCRFAATLEHLIIYGASSNLHQAGIDAYIAKAQGRLSLWPEPIMGTFSEFAQGLLRFLSLRSDFHAIGGEPYFTTVLQRRLKQCLHDVFERQCDAGGALSILHGDTPHWRREPASSERIVRQPAFDEVVIHRGDFIQFMVPPSGFPQVIAGFELCTDDRALLDQWSDVGGWFMPRFQREDRAAALLPEFEDDALNARVDGAGSFWVQAVGIPATEAGPPDLPAEMKRLLVNVPEHWPGRYAESMAFVTFIERQSLRHTKQTSAHQRVRRLIELGRADDYPPSPTSVRPHIYRATYRVV
ncbi:hypothetical protein PQ455_03410 [Sphingomonas naphthae]|uniref:Uncharacterized protein n=1 Tax=Sphingomonas naphthae TaxID=1813468 RepID=A0ABY7TR16_9SPHN|nr:hypothetical protein [Sphingomonas naphthae]WCT74289.1 hypothetical protein PQ455_03410 [Sphingomonas naphthae]